jgi:hypothetical protein
MQEKYVSADGVSPRSRIEYERAFRLVLEHKTKTGTELGRLPASAMSARAADKLYLALQRGDRVVRRLRQANVCMIRMARAWDTVQRLYPNVVPANNPFRGLDLEHGHRTTRPATRAEAYALHAALVAAGEPHLGVVPFICFEWHQRPENVLSGHIA